MHTCSMYICVHTCISSTYICTDVLYYYDVNMIELIIYYYILDILLLKLSFPLRTLCCRAGCSFYQFYKLISFFLCTILKYAYMFYPHLPYTFETNRKNIFSPQNKKARGTNTPMIPVRTPSHHFAGPFP